MSLALQGMSAFGAALHAVGSVLIVYGQTIVKVGHCIEESSVLGSSWNIGNPQQKPKWRRPDGKWRQQQAGSKVYASVGWFLFSVGNILRFISMRFAAQTVLSGLGSLQFVVIPIASRSLLGIKPQASTMIGVATVLIGNMFIILYGPSETSFTLAQLRTQWTTPAMKGFLLILGALLLGLHMLWRHLHRLRRKAEAEANNRTNSTVDSVLSLNNNGLSATHSRNNSSGSLIPLEVGGPGVSPPPKQAPAILRTASSGTLKTPINTPNNLNTFTAALLFSAVASFVGAWSVLFSKSLTYVVTAAPESFFDWYSWFTVIAFLGSAIYWVRQSNKGLKLYPATLIMPLMQAFWMCMSVLEGMIYFDEIRYLTANAVLMLMLGLLLALIGAVAMGLAGYFNEGPAIISLAMSPLAGTSPDVESQRLLGGGGYHAHKNSGLPMNLEPVLGHGDGLVEVGGRKKIGDGVELVGRLQHQRNDSSGGLDGRPNSGGKDADNNGHVSTAFNTSGVR